MSYMENEQFQAVDLPYGDELFAMTVLLPKAGHDVNSVAASLSPEAWAEHQAAMQDQLGSLWLPKFEMEYEKGLKQTLQALGMLDAFVPGSADFTGINTDSDLYITAIKHKTFVAVDEEGTEAAAVTSIEFERTSAGPEGFVMHVDEPFLFVLSEKTTGTLLFMGKVVDPS